MICYLCHFFFLSYLANEMEKKKQLYKKKQKTEAANERA